MTKNFVSCTPYLRKHTSYDHGFCYKCVKWWHLQKLVFFFSKFWFSGLLGEWKGKKWPKVTKNSVCLTSYLRNCTSYDFRLWYICVEWLYLQQFFSCFKILIFWFLIFKTLYLRNCRSYHQDFWCTGVK